MENTDQDAFSALITDDIAQNRFYIADILRQTGIVFDITEAENGKDAVEKVTHHIHETGRSFNLIIMDYRMPELNGAAATAAIRQLETPLAPTQRSFIITWSTSFDTPYPQADDWLPKMTDANQMKEKLQLFDLTHGG